MTIDMSLRRSATRQELESRYRDFYAREPLVRFGEEAPLVRDSAGSHQCRIGGLTLEEPGGRRAVVVATLDNLLKGAATQAVQNINLACGFEELAGIPV